MIKVGLQDGPRVTVMEYSEGTNWKIEEGLLEIRKANSVLAAYKTWVFVAKGEAV